MTTGVQGFIGERLTEAREAREIMTQSALAGLLGVSKNAISLYESNKSRPRPEIVAELAKLLHVKESFFFIPLLAKEENPIFWRSRHAALKDHRTIAKRRYDWSKWLIDGYLKSFLDMPELCLPTRAELGVPENPEHLTEAHIEKISLLVREFWGLGLLPIDSMVSLLENNGILITYSTFHSEKLDAFSSVSEYDHSFHIRLSMDKGSAVRSRFDAAHELGHMILHSHLSSSYLNKKHHRLLESQANRFASAFLLPTDSFQKDLWMLSMEAFMVLKKQWKVSVGAMIQRCDDLGLFGEHESKVQRMWIKYRREWKIIEQEDTEFEKPQLMRRCIDTLIEEKVKTKRQILFDIPFHEKDVESLLNLPEGYLREDFGEVKFFPTIKPNSSSSVISSVGAQIIPLKKKRNS